MRNFFKKATALILVVIILIVAVPIASISASAATLPKEVKGKTISEVLKMDPKIYIDWLNTHSSDDYYLKTPYKPYDRRNPNGDCKGKYGAYDQTGVPAMNCTGFVWHVLYQSTKKSAGDTNKIPALSGWYNFYNNNNITRKYFNSKTDMLKSGYLTKGDIIWMFNGSETSVSDYHHVGIYWGDGKSDILWHSIDSANSKSGNIQTIITPKAQKPLYVVLKTGVPLIKLQLQKSTNNSNAKYTSMSGAKYNIYLNKACTDYFGYITTDKDGFGRYGTGKNGTDVPLQTYYCKEVNAPKGFAVDKTVYTFSKTSSSADGSVIYKASCNDNPYIKLQLLKSSANSDITDENRCYSLRGAIYTVYTDKACTKSTNMQLKTNSLGYSCYKTGDGTNTDTKDKSLPLYKKNSGQNVTLEKGITYYCKETQAPPGYELDDTVYTFKDSGCVSSDGVRIFRAVNGNGKQPSDNPINDPVGIVLQKKNAVTGETTNQGLEGAIFEIQYYSQEIDKDYDIDTSIDFLAPALDEANLKRTWYIKTDEYGFADYDESYFLHTGNYISDDFYYSNEKIITIPIGTIVIKEVEAPSGYTISNTVFYRRINEEIASLAQDTNTPIKIPIDEQPANGYIGIHKMNNSREGVANAVYGLYADESATELVSQLTTDADGKGIFDCKAAVNKTYYIKEISAPPGYSLDTTIYPVTAATANSTVETAIIQDIYEDSIKGDIIIKKSSNDGIVSNIYFALSDNLGNTYNAVATDSTGTAKYTGLPVYDSDGNKINYTVKELGFKTTPGKKSYGGFTWTVKAENCIRYKGAYYEGVANNTFSDCEYAYSRYYYGNKTEAVNNSNGYTKTLVDNSAVTFNFNNTVKTTDVEINKQSYDDRKSGVWFKIVDQTGKSYGEIATDDSGCAAYSKQYSKSLYSCITVPNSAISLKIKYRIEELGFKNPGSNTYYLPDTYINNVVSDYKSDSLSAYNYVINFEVYNSPDVGRIEINKSSDDGITEDICFKISAYEDDTEYSGEMYDATIGYDANGNKLNSIIVKTAKNGTASSEGVQLYDCNGNAMNGLPVYLFGENDYEITYEITELGFDNGDGTYTLPKRYISNEPFRCTLLENRFITYECVNTIKTGQLQIKKTSEDNIVDNICFNVRSLNIDDVDIIIDTDAEGVTDIIDDLPIYVPSTKDDVLVEYEITELGHIGENGYEIPLRYKTPNPIKITLNENSTVTFTAFHNQLKKGSVTLYKQDYNGQALSGSEWKLYKSDDSPVTTLQNGNGTYLASDKGKDKTLLTDSKGKMVISDLAQGDYYFIETKSPNGTFTYGKKINFTISAESNSALSPILTVKNNKIVMFNTGGNGNSKIYIAGFIMLAMSFAIISAYIFKTKKQHNSK